jgi:hypothetical protein
MFANVSVVGVLLAAISAMIVGTIWYSKAVFGGQWMSMMGISDKDMKKGMAQAMVWLVGISLVTAFVLAQFIVYVHAYMGGSWLAAGFETALWAWLGLAATAIFAHGVFDPRDKKVLYINAVNRLVTLLVMGLIIGAFM